MPIHPFLLLKMVNCLIFVGFQLCFPPKKIFTNMSVNLSSSSHPTINNRFDVRYCLHPAQTKCFLSGFDVLGTVKCRSQILQYRSGPSFGTPTWDSQLNCVFSELLSTFTTDSHTILGILHGSRELWLACYSCLIHCILVFIWNRLMVIKRRENTV